MDVVRLKIPVVSGVCIRVSLTVNPQFVPETNAMVKLYVSPGIKA